MAEENKPSGFVTGFVVAVVAVIVATVAFNDYGYMRRGHRVVVAPAPVSAVVGAGSGSVPSGQPEYVLTDTFQRVEATGCTPGTYTPVNGRLVQCATSVPQTTGACWRSRSTGQCMPNRTFEQGPPDQSASGNAQASSNSSEGLVGPP